jgi:hypothetical protein
MPMTLAGDPRATLRESRGLRSKEEFAAFVSAMAALGERLDPADLPELYRSFDDGTEDYGAFWSLIHLIEQYDWAKAASAYIEVLPDMVATAHEWMETLAIRQLNNDAARQLLVEAGRAGEPANRAALRDLLAGVATGDESGVVYPVAARAAEALAALDA